MCHYVGYKLGHIFCGFHNDFTVCEIFILKFFLYQDTFHGKDTSTVWKYNHKKLFYANYEIKASQKLPCNVIFVRFKFS